MTHVLPYREPGSAPSSSTLVGEPSELQRLRAERDQALEELVFLREQLCSAEAFYAYRLELEYARLYAEHRGFLDELTRLSAEFHRRARRDTLTREDPRGDPAGPADATVRLRVR
jgi:hypothetical protein